MSSRAPITVVIGRFADLLALGLGTLLDGDASVEVVARDVAPGHLPAVLRVHHPSVLVLDVAALRDLAEVRELVRAHERTHLVLLGADVAGPEASQLLAFGASACLSGDTQSRDVLTAVHLASRGLQLMPRAAHDAHAAAASASRLTPREGDVLLLLRQGRTNAEIALALQIGLETVRTHVRSVFGKLGVRSRRALLALPASAPPAPPPPPAPRPARARRAPGTLAERRRLHD